MLHTNDLVKSGLLPPMLQIKKQEATFNETNLLLLSYILQMRGELITSVDSVIQSSQQ